jgi:alpha-glucuronidase
MAPLASRALSADTGAEAWLRYAPLTSAARAKYDSLPASVVVLDTTPLLKTSENELIRGVRGMTGRTLRAENKLPQESAIVLGTNVALREAAPEWQAPAGLSGDGFALTTGRIHGFDCLIVTGTTDRSVLYGVFALLRRIALEEDLKSLNEQSQPYASIRWVNQWDNLDGRIERGYGGRSIFFDNGAVRADLSRAADYARLLASLGIDGCVVNNVNANPRVLALDFLPQLARIADAFRPWGVQLAISVDFTSPKTIGGPDTFDPLDSRVAAWWKDKADEIYRQIPDFGGFVVKADSEGRVGPSAYGRTAANAANMIARALKPHGGVLFYRAFVYDHHLDWRNLKNDRARAAYDIFHPLDGTFDGNVIIQIKNGPIDFQVR